MITTGMIMFVVGIVGMVFSLIIGGIILYRDSKMKYEKESMENIVNLENQLNFNGKSKTEMIMTENMRNKEK
ncbi:hypothetical protein CPAST_c06960 [Clostridium pasteurianum DSM 525 = ATCC 6013]|uniref:Uncharacterized protein n=1 Tax=Clostridium pasteurianum DSM 525 = ATCC 6013 TaxID=1262449 RepID=A0A0H3IZ50_CLOPA|nr:hypothetical protein [Clostridium pasteurianum]AJA46796.1 hypothetical protein CPAST_c06960 [Clostridium pasteurianum DSM 525 = ATCC 6013]AJA50784.1 hypothetical protein CLPA_c06960 [Clostridium pasteurianum DSM 525 = ATCC 6013]AOZ74190.1 hypothetical protein AQ983_03350 [Clostridium pasteurianum DSM 525 = ATCC 6013]AOZ77988.1 hypothetical protein AQ984_03350 [Clostridium pasteurianum]ELP58593.1 hypothetical protein F502_13975 [Clostridium pasteurianum DSM 525 = ATCC 6013]